MKKILVTGTFSSGKTTLCRVLNNQLTSLGISSIILPDVARQCTLPLNKNQTILTSCWLAFRQLSAESNIKGGDYDFLILDRGLFDIIAHSLLLTNITKADRLVLKEIINFTCLWAQSIDSIYLSKCSDLPVQIDGLRIPDKAFQLQLEECLFQLLDENFVQYKILDSSTESRVSQILREHNLIIS